MAKQQRTEPKTDPVQVVDQNTAPGVPQVEEAQPEPTPPTPEAAPEQPPSGVSKSTLAEMEAGRKALDKRSQ